MNDLTEHPRHRAENGDRATTRMVRQLGAPYRATLGKLNLTTARLRGLKEHGHPVDAEIVALRNEVVAQSSALREARSSLRGAPASHSLLGDLDRGYARLLTTLDALLPQERS